VNNNLYPVSDRFQVIAAYWFKLSLLTEDASNSLVQSEPQKQYSALRNLA